MRARFDIRFWRHTDGATLVVAVVCMLLWGAWMENRRPAVAGRVRSTMRVVFSPGRADGSARTALPFMDMLETIGPIRSDSGMPALSRVWLNSHPRFLERPASSAVVAEDRDSLDAAAARRRSDYEPVLALPALFAVAPDRQAPSLITELSPSLAAVDLQLPSNLADVAAYGKLPSWQAVLRVSGDADGALTHVFMESAPDSPELAAALVRLVRQAKAGKSGRQFSGRLTVSYGL